MNKNFSSKIYSNLTITEMHNAGRAIAKQGNQILYIDFGIPGEIVDISAQKSKFDYMVGQIKNIKQASPNRVKPICRHFGFCGGCNWQHMSYEEQLKQKREILINALKKYQIKTPAIPAVIPSEKTTFYRNKLEYAFSASRWYFPHEGKIMNPYDRLALGFHLIDEPNKIIDIKECWLQAEPSRKICRVVKEIAWNQKISFYNPREKQGYLRSMTIRTSSTGEVMLIFGIMGQDTSIIEKLIKQLIDEVPNITSVYFGIIPSHDKGISDAKLELYQGLKEFITEKIEDITFRISPKSFFQPNVEQAAIIYNKILQYAAFSGTETVFDLYSGVGTIACFIAKHVNKVIAMDGLPEAIEDAKINAAINNISNISFFAGDILHSFTIKFLKKHGLPEVVILDPPRSGTLIEIKKTIIQAEPKKIIYVSCNPVSLAYDLKQFTEKYKVTAIQPFDMFPHTHQLETVVLLEK